MKTYWEAFFGSKHCFPFSLFQVSKIPIDKHSIKLRAITITDYYSERIIQQVQALSTYFYRNKYKNE